MNSLTTIGKVFLGAVIVAAILIFLVVRGVFAAPAPKVDVCHKTGEQWELININESAVDAHLEHGDFLVDDDNPCPPVDPVDDPVDEPEDEKDKPEVPEITDEERAEKVVEFEESGVK